MTIKLSTKQSLTATVAAIAGGLFGVGVSFQQPLMTGAGVGLAGGCLVKPRRQESELTDLAQLVANSYQKIQKLDDNINILVKRDTQRDLQLTNLIHAVTGIQESYHQLETQIQSQLYFHTQSNVHLNDLTDCVSEIGQINQELISQFKTQKTQLNLHVKAIQKLQQAHHEHQGIATNQKQEIINCCQAISDLSNILNQTEQFTAKNPSSQPTTHLLIDGNAMRFIEQKIGKIDYRQLREILTKDANQIKCKFYLADTKKPAQKQFIAALEKIGFEVLLFPLVNYDGGIQKTKGDDVQMAIDAVRAKPGDRVILCGGGDGDFVPVVNRLKEMGIDFTVVAYQQNLSSHLKRVAGENLMYLSTANNK